MRASRLGLLHNIDHAKREQSSGKKKVQESPLPTNSWKDAGESSDPPAGKRFFPRGQLQVLMHASSIRVRWGMIYRDSGKENGNYHITIGYILYWGYMGFV